VEWRFCFWVEGGSAISWFFLSGGRKFGRFSGFGFGLAGGGGVGWDLGMI